MKLVMPLQVYPVNNDELVNDVIAALGATGDEEVNGKTLKEALTTDFEIKTPSKDLIAKVAENSGDSELLALLENKEEMSNFLWGSRYN